MSIKIKPLDYKNKFRLVCLVDLPIGEIEQNFDLSYFQVHTHESYEKQQLNYNNCR